MGLIIYCYGQFKLSEVLRSLVSCEQNNCNVNTMMALKLCESSWMEKFIWICSKWTKTFPDQLYSHKFVWFSWKSIPDIILTINPIIIFVDLIKAFSLTNKPKLGKSKTIRWIITLCSENVIVVYASSK